MKLELLKISLLGFLAVLLVQCSQVETPNNPIEMQDPPAEETAEPEAAPEPASQNQDNSQENLMEDEQIPPSGSAPVEPGMENLVDEAMSDLAERLSISTAEIELVEARLVTWPDSSLGCPQPGMAYTQVPEDGALVVLRAQGMVYQYHSGGSRGIFLCEKVSKDPSKPPLIDLFNLTPPSYDKNDPPPLTPDNSIPPNKE